MKLMFIIMAVIIGISVLVSIVSRLIMYLEREEDIEKICRLVEENHAKLRRKGNSDKR